MTKNFVKLQLKLFLVLPAICVHHKSQESPFNFGHFANFYVQMCRSSVNVTKQVVCVCSEEEVRTKQ